MASVADPAILGFSLLLGIVPALVWLWFWFKEDLACPEPKGLIFFTFILGMAATIVVIPIQKIIKTMAADQTTMVVLAAAAEEALKFAAVALVALKSKYLDEPIDYSIYMITAAMGFAALENALFLIEPLSLSGTTTGLFSGSLRFLGATLLHGITSGIAGIMLGFAFYKSRFIKKLALGFGLACAVAIHSLFNVFVINNSGASVFKIFLLPWGVAVLCMFLFERLERMKKEDFVCLT